MPDAPTPQRGAVSRLVRPGLRLLACAAAGILLARGQAFAQGPWVYAALLGWIVLAAATLLWASPGLLPGRARRPLQLVLLAAASLVATLLLLEAALAYHENHVNTYWRDKLKRQQDAAQAPQAADPAALVIPAELDRQVLRDEGGYKAWRWMGKLHEADPRGFRRLDPLPPKRAGSWRVLCLGDSFTYGEGVAREEAWPARLQDLLGSGNAEVLNLGVRGASIGDIAATLDDLGAALQPDLVLYGVCLNDYLPDNHWVAPHDLSWSVPLPDVVKDYFFRRTTSGRFFTQAYNRALLALGLREDMQAQMTRIAKRYREEFSRNAGRLAARATGLGLRPPLAMVLNQMPERGDRLTIETQDLLRAAGLDLVPVNDFLDSHHGVRMMVNRWEAHPDARAHALYAGLFHQALQSRGLPPARRP